MPKQKITKEMIVEAAFEIARKEGAQKVLVKEIARQLNCSVQPVYSYCSNMEGLRSAVSERALLFVKEYITKHADREDFFSSTGRAYVRLAKEEPHIFQMFAAHERNGIHSMDELYQTQADRRMAENIAKQLGISTSKARSLHLKMLIFNVGIGTILATTRPGIPEEEILNQLEEAFQAFLKQILEEEQK